MKVLDQKQHYASRTHKAYIFVGDGNGLQSLSTEKEHEVNKAALLLQKQKHSFQFPSFFILLGSIYP